MRGKDAVIDIDTPQTPPGVPILQDSVWSEPSCSWDDSCAKVRSGEPTTNADSFFPTDPNSPRRRVSAAQLLDSWLRLRWRLSRSLFSVPVPFFTVKYEVKVGDLIITFPVILVLLVVSAVQASGHNVNGSGTSPSIALALVFGFAVRNNSLVIISTGISFERALFYHKLFAFVLIVVVALHSLAYMLRRLEGDIKIDRSAKVQSGLTTFVATSLLYSLSLGPVRRRFHEFFVKTHWILFIVIMIAAVLHGAAIALVGILPWEIDMFFRLVYRRRVYTRGSFFCTRPRPTSDDSFISDSSYKVVRKSLGVAACDQIKVYQLPDDMTCIEFPRVRSDTGEEFTYKAGQYCFLSIPAVSTMEWHPFSISSSPHEKNVTFHVKAVGDWTMKLLQAAAETCTDNDEPFDVLIDGPYGSLSIDIEDPTVYSHFVFFAGGMGVTATRSIANWLYNESNVSRSRVVRRVRFVWSVSDSESLQALMNLQADRWTNTPQAPYLPDVLLCPTTLNVSSETFFTEIYLSRGLVGCQAELDPQLSKCLWFHCRPDVEQTLREVGTQAERDGKSRVAVVVCGPKSMTKDVANASLMVAKEMKLHFDVHSERFSL